MVKLNERGRGKFKPAPDYNVEEVKRVLFEKIEEELQLNIDEPLDFSEDDLNYEEDKLNMLSLFCGAGGLDLGVELAGLDVVFGEEETSQAFKNKDSFEMIRHKGVFNHIFANDFFPEALQTYKANFPKNVLVHHKDIRKIKKFPKADIVCGGFPCPGFSEAGPRLVDDPRNFLYIHFIRCLMQAQPSFFIAENVKGMLTLGKGEVFKQIVQDFSAAGYRVYHKLVNARDYGVPQLRERVFLVGVREDIDFEYEFPEPSHGEGIFSKKPYVTLKDAIGDLECDPGEYFTGSYSTIFMSRNRKKRWDEQSFTIQASGRQAPIHPGGLPMEKLEKDSWHFPDGEENNRRLSVKEIARIQTFPDWYYFNDGGSIKGSLNSRLDKIYKQIGNAVPVQLARAISRPIAKWFADNREEGIVPVTNAPKTNVLIALNNILKNGQKTLPEVLNHSNSNRINSVGDLLEFFVKDAFCGDTMTVPNSGEKLKHYQEKFSYLGNSNNPPDFVIKHGAAVEVKKVESNQYGPIALNSSAPKDYLHGSDERIKKECRECEDEFGGWTKKDMIYAIGNVSEDKIHSLWFIYGDCFCADKSTYELVANRIKDGVTTIDGVEFSKTKELGRVNRVDPLGITYLRIRGMWGIEHPSTVFSSQISFDAKKTNIYTLMKKDTYEALTEKPDFSEFTSSGLLTVKDILIPNPNNPAKNMEAVLFTATF